MPAQVPLHAKRSARARTVRKAGVRVCTKTADAGRAAARPQAPQAHPWPMLVVAHDQAVIRHPAPVLCKEKVATAVSFTALPFITYPKVAGTTTYARSPSTVNRLGLPIVPTGSVIPCFCANASKDLDQLAHAPDPRHSNGGISSMTDASSAQLEILLAESAPKSVRIYR